MYNNREYQKTPKEIKMPNYSRTQSGSATVTRVSVTNQLQTPVAANDNREGLMIFNDSDRTLLVSFGSTVSSTNFSLKIPAGGYYESGATVYTGAVHITWIDPNIDGTGAALITEMEV